MITSLDVKQNDNGTTHVKYTASFTGTSHIAMGTLTQHQKKLQAHLNQ